MLLVNDLEPLTAKAMELGHVIPTQKAEELMLVLVGLKAMELGHVIPTQKAEELMLVMVGLKANQLGSRSLEMALGRS